jgi:hypothetical protein
MRKGLISDAEYHVRSKRSVDETKEEDNFDSHPTTTSCSTDKENQDNNYSHSRLLPPGKSQHNASSAMKENSLPLIISSESKHPLASVKSTEFNFTFNPNLA